MMGLDCSHECWHGAYSAFSKWRNQIAVAGGYQIGRMIDGSGYQWDAVLVDWGHLQHVLLGDWDFVPNDPLMYLIAHSDCDGVIYPEAAARLADRLEELLPALPTEDDPGHIGNWRDKTKKFIDGLRDASSKHESVEFY